MLYTNNNPSHNNKTGKLLTKENFTGPVQIVKRLYCYLNDYYITVTVGFLTVVNISKSHITIIALLDDIINLFKNK